MLDSAIRYAGPHRTVEVFGLRLLGVSADSGKKLLFTLGLVAAVALLSAAVRGVLRLVTGRNDRAAFWVRQGVHLASAAVLLLGFISIWFDDPGRVTAAGGLVTAGIAVALQKVITSFAGYLMILRSRTFNVGDRITMGGVRGDVIALGFLQTTIMEMGQPPDAQQDPPAMWVEARQYTGRIVTVSNSQLFDQPVYNYTRDFPYLWEELRVPISYKADRANAERILLDAARRHSVDVATLDDRLLEELQRRSVLRREELGPRVYLRLTDNWIELAVRFLVEDHGIREVKNRISRDVLAAFDEAKLGVASATFEVVGLPPVEVRTAAPPK